MDFVVVVYDYDDNNYNVYLNVVVVVVVVVVVCFQYIKFVSAASGRPHPVLGVVYPNKGICFVIIAVVIHIKYASRFQILTSTSAIWYI